MKKSLFGYNAKAVEELQSSFALERATLQEEIARLRQQLEKSKADFDAREVTNLAQLTELRGHFEAEQAAHTALKQQRLSEIEEIHRQVTHHEAELNAEIERLQEELSRHKASELDSAEALMEARQTLEASRLAAERERELILEAAHQHAEEIQQRAQRRAGEEGWELHRMKIERQKFVESFRSLLLRQLEELDRALQMGSNPTAGSHGPAGVATPTFNPMRGVPAGFEAPESN